jgi:asparagine N-glycosylation enzyme membrane subunit Stt3
MQQSDMSVSEMVGEVVDVGAGVGIILLPLFATALPGIILLLILPAVLLAAVAALPVVIGALLIGPPYLVVRALRRRRG